MDDAAAPEEQVSRPECGLGCEDPGRLDDVSGRRLERGDDGPGTGQ